MPTDPLAPPSQSRVFTTAGSTFHAVPPSAGSPDRGYTAAASGHSHFGSPAHQSSGMIPPGVDAACGLTGMALAFQRGRDRVAVVQRRGRHLRRWTSTNRNGCRREAAGGLLRRKHPVPGWPATSASSRLRTVVDRGPATALPPHRVATTCWRRRRRSRRPPAGRRCRGANAVSSDLPDDGHEGRPRVAYSAASPCSRLGRKARSCIEQSPARSGLADLPDPRTHTWRRSWPHSNDGAGPTPPPSPVDRWT